MNRLANPHLLLLLTTFIWGGNAVAGKFAVGHISPMMLTCARWAIALVVLLVFAHRILWADRHRMRAHWVYLAAMGATGYALFNFFLYSALQYTSVINVTLEQAAMPVVIFVLNYALYRIGVTWLQVLGYAVTVVGVLVVVTGGDPVGYWRGEGATLNRGDLMMLGAALAYGGYSVGLRSKPDMHWFSLLGALVAAAFLASLVGVGFEIAAGDAVFPVTGQGWAVAVFAGIFPSLVSQGLFIKGVEALGANLAGLYINLVPVFGALLAVLLVGERLHPFHAVAFLLVVGGITLAQRTARTP